MGQLVSVRDPLVSLACGLQTRLCEPASKCERSTCVYLPSTGIVSESHCSQLSPRFWGYNSDPYSCTANTTNWVNPEAPETLFLKIFSKHWLLFPFHTHFQVDLRPSKSIMSINKKIQRMKSKETTAISWWKKHQSWHHYLQRKKQHSLGTGLFRLLLHGQHPVSCLYIPKCGTR